MDTRARRGLMLLIVLAGCGGSGPGASEPSGPRLASQIASERWFTVPTRCGQGPYELDLTALGARWGEGVDVMVASPRGVQLTAVFLKDGTELRRVTPAAGGKLDNARCVADAVAVHSALGASAGHGDGGGGGGGGDGGEGGVSIVDRGGGDGGGRLELTAVDGGAGELEAQQLIGYSWPTFELDGPQITAGAQLRVRLWATVPNDLDGVRIGLIHFVERPTVTDAAYERHLRAEIAARQAREAERLRRAEADLRPARATVHAPPSTAALEQQRRAREAAIERYQAEQAAALERARRAADEQRRREAYCAAHLGDTGCWGAGGYRIHADLERRRGQREVYCDGHPDDARCWDDAGWARHRQAWAERLDRARRGADQPAGPPPVPRAEAMTPGPSANAEWRPGYWYWHAPDWIWIAGMWRVPEADIVAERTTQAPSAPPVDEVESPPPAPTTTLIWVNGYWQWDGGAWLWVAGSWQPPPAARASWRPARWVPRGAIHILVPGGWITP